MPVKPKSIAVRRSANHGFRVVAGAAAVAGVADPGPLDALITLDARSVQFSLSIIPSENPTVSAVTPRAAVISALTMSILPVNWAEPVNPTGVPAVNRSKSGAVPEISRVVGVRPNSSNVAGNSIAP